MSTVTDLRPQPAARMVWTPGTSRAERAAELEALADAVTLGVAPSPRSLRLQVCAWASERWSPQAAMERWDLYAGEVRRRQAVEAGEPYWRDISPDDAKRDEADALNDLIDGTSKLKGDRF